nr:MAG TPA: Regulator of RpoS, Anti-adapter protein regulator, ClpXP adaptor, anti-adaptor.0A [Caudoviricetes sp.]
MIYVTSDQEINYSPKNYIEEVVTNVGMLLRVCKEEQPLNRDFSFDSDLIDKNINVVENKIMAQLLETFRRYEPRALLKTTQIIIKDKYRNEFEITLGIEVIEIE